MIDVITAIALAVVIVAVLFGAVAAVGTLLAKIDEIHDTRDE